MSSVSIRAEDSTVVIAAEALQLASSSTPARLAVVWRGLFVAAIVAVAISYVATLSPGHVFLNDDFAAYVMHARNLAEGRPYSDIRYIPNPDAMWLSPASGYPPIYPMILAPVYKVFGLDLRAFKIATVLCFVGFCAVFIELVRKELGGAGTAMLVALVSFNPVFWGQRDFILSEFTYLLFSFAALLAIERVYARLEPKRIAIPGVLVVSALLYCAYGTRTIGIALVVAFIAADLAKFRRPSRFLLCVLALMGVFVGAQTVLLTSPTGYVSAFHFSVHTIVTNTLYYGKTLSYVWANGFSKGAQIVFALLFTATAVWGFLKSVWREHGAKDFYLLAYIAVLLAWNSEIGLRGLLPILPLYFFYGLREWVRFFDMARLPVRVIAIGALIGFAAVSYAGEIRSEGSAPAEPNIADADAAKLLAFVHGHTSPEDVLVFPKPRTLALFTDRRVAAISPEQTEAQSLSFLRSIHATVVIDPEWSAVRANDAMTRIGARQIFSDGRYHVYRVTLATGN
jgi:hypothetical protein